MTPRMKELMSIRQTMTIHDLARLDELQRGMDSLMKTDTNTPTLVKSIWEVSAVMQDAIIDKYLVQGR